MRARMACSQRNATCMCARMRAFSACVCARTRMCVRTDAIFGELELAAFGHLEGSPPAPHQAGHPTEPEFNGVRIKPEKRSRAPDLFLSEHADGEPPLGQGGGSRAAAAREVLTRCGAQGRSDRCRPLGLRHRRAPEMPVGKKRSEKIRKEDPGKGIRETDPEKRSGENMPALGPSEHREQRAEQRGALGEHLAAWELDDE